MVPKPVSSSSVLDVGDDLAALVDPLDRIGSRSWCDPRRGCRRRTGTTDAITSAMPGLVGSPPSLTTIRSTSDGTALLGGLGPLADAEDRRRHHDADRDEHDHADREQHAEVADHRHLRQLQRQERDDAGDRGCDQRRRQVRHGLGDRVLVVVEHHLLLDAVVDLDREVDAEPDQDRQTRDRDQRQVDADQAEDRERPDHADQHGEQREQAPPHPEHQGRARRHHDRARSTPSVNMPPLR